MKVRTVMASAALGLLIGQTPATAGPEIVEHAMPGARCTGEQIDMHNGVAAVMGNAECIFEGFSISADEIQIRHPGEGETASLGLLIKAQVNVVLLQHAQELRLRSLILERDVSR